MLDEISQGDKKTVTPISKEVPQTPAPTTPTGGGQVPQTPAPTTQQASFYNPEKEIDKLHGYFVAVVLFVVISFLGTFFLLTWDHIKDKDLYIKYNDLDQMYSQKVIELNNKINQQEIEINNLKNQMDMLHAKNVYLK